MRNSSMSDKNKNYIGGVKYISASSRTVTVPRKDMQKEINKYQGRIFYFDKSAKKIYPANWIQTLNDYNHYEYELHHIVPYSDWEKNTKNVRELVPENGLILLPKIMHQHLENPVYKLSKVDFERVYGINPDLILFDVNSRIKDNFNIINLFTLTTADTTIPVSANFLLTEEDLACFDSIYDKTGKELHYA